ncbi:MAG: hypothetical protein K6G11_08245 [Lachnospiraceae bacterium]|nr:hypothetical protein [Lachnospiraceae bacterium]
MEYSNLSNEELENLVLEGDEDAIIELAGRYTYGTEGTEINYTRAYQLLHKGEKRGLKNAYIGIGELYRNGWFFAKNEELASKYYMKAGVDYPKDNNQSNTSSDSTSSDYMNNENYNSNNDSMAFDIEYLRNLIASAMNNMGNSDNSLSKKNIYKVFDYLSKFDNGIDVKYEDEIDDIVLDANWILACIANEENDYEELCNRLQFEGVIGKYPFGMYLLAEYHDSCNLDSRDEDINNLMMISENDNLSDYQKGMVFNKIGLLILSQNRDNQEIAKPFFQRAIMYGDESAKQTYDNLFA